MDSIQEHRDLNKEEVLLKENPMKVTPLSHSLVMFKVFELPSNKRWLQLRTAVVLEQPEANPKLVVSDYGYKVS